MTSSLPEDPYKALGVTKDAQLPEIRSAHRKLVLKCHPDKVQDPALKAIKQDEFQKVQQAYELLSDDVRRSQYDESVRLMDLRNELRREMGKASGGSPHFPPPGKSVFDYEIRTAEPRSSTFKSKPKEPTNGYSRPTPRSFEDDFPSKMYDEPSRSTPKKTPSYEDRKRSTTKEDERRKKSDDDRDREKERREKDAKRSAHSSAKKSRDKERKKGSEDKHHRTVYVEDDDSEEAAYRSPKPEKKSSRKLEEEIRMREEQARAAEKLRDDNAPTERTRKLNIHTDFAAQYMQAARQKVEPEADFGRKPLRRAETFQEPSYSTRYVVPPAPYVTVEDDESPRRSSAYATPRRASQDIPFRNRDPTSPRDRNVSGGYGPEPVIIDATPPPSMKPSLQSHSSAPPIVQESSRKESGRSKTMQAQYSRSPPRTPLLSRASTFQGSDKAKAKPKSRGSKLKSTVQYASDGSDSEGPTYASPRSHSPPVRSREPEEVRYKIDNGRSVPLPRHRSALREDNYDDAGGRSVSPRGGPRSFERPPLNRSSGSGSSSRQTSSRTPTYFPRATSPEPIIKTARPKLSRQDSNGRSSSSFNPYFGEVRYAQNYGPEHVTYSPEQIYRRGSDPTGHRDYAYPPPRPSREAAYA